MLQRTTRLRVYAAIPPLGEDMNTMLYRFKPEATNYSGITKSTLTTDEIRRFLASSVGKEKH